MTGSVSEVRPGFFRVRAYSHTDPHTGRQVLRSKTYPAPGIRDARKQADEIVGTWRHEADLAAKDIGTVNELVTRWLRIQHSKADTSPTYLRRAEAICLRISDQLGRILAHDLAPVHVTDWYVWLRGLNVGTKKKPRRMAEATVLHHHRILSAVLNQAQFDGLVDRVVTAKRAPKATRYEVRLPNDADLTKLIRSAAPSLRAVVTFAAYTGLRRGELFGLRWEDIEPGIVHVRRAVIELAGGGLTDKVPKGRRSRIVYIGPEVDSALEMWRADLDALAARRGATLATDARVFPDLTRDPTGRTPMRPGWLTLAWSRHCKDKGVHVRIHDLRHWFGSRLMARATPKDAQNQLGHAQLSTTLNLYAHVTEGTEARVRAALSGALAP